MKFLIEEDLANTILNYLVQQPFREVFQMVQALQQLEKAEEDE